MKRRHWLRQIGAGLMAAALAAGAVPLETLTPLMAEESQVPQNQIASAPETVYLDQIGTSERQVNINDHWRFILADPSGASQSTFDDSKWEDVDLPHDYSINQDITSAGEAESGYRLGGTAWYRKTFSVAPEMKGKQIVLQFNGVYMDASVYLNGKKLGDHPYGYTAFAFDLTDDLNYEGDNVISVRVNHQTPSSRWYSGSGIYRDVYLNITDKVHAAYQGVAVSTPNLAAETAANSAVTTQANVTVDNDSDAAANLHVVQSVLDKDGNVVGTASSQNASLAAGASTDVSVNVMVSNPALWSTKAPNLYTLKTEIYNGDDVVDTVETTFGYRWYEFDDDTGFSLNGEKMKLKGVCMHHDQGSLGSAAYDRAIERQVELLKQMGCNSIRITHNPGDEAMLRACSEQGILVINELFDGWIAQKNGNYNDYARFFNKTLSASDHLINGREGETWSEFDTKSTVLSSRNEASVIMYSLCNEVFEGTASGFSGETQIAQNLVSYIQELDNTRLVTFGGNGLKNGSSGEFNIGDVVAAAGGVVGANYMTSEQFASLRSSRPDYKLVYSESASHVNSRGVYDRTGSRTDKNGDKLLTSYDYSAVGWGKVASDAWYTTITADYVAGEYVWTGFDYLGEPTPWNGTGSGYTGGSNSPKTSYFGIIDTAGLPKDNYYLYQSQWNEDVTTLHVLPAWNRNVVSNTSSVPVVVYSNAASVELFITPDGGTRQSLGKKTFTKKTTDAGFTYQIFEGSGKSSTQHENLYLKWNVPYQDGKLEAVAYDESGNIISQTEGRSSVETTGSAARLQANADHTTVQADGDDLSYITIDVTDSEGRIVPDAANLVSVTVDGAGELAAMDNGCQPDHQNFNEGNYHAHAGSLIAIVKSNGEEGPITVNISADGLESTTVTLNAKAEENTTPVTSNALSSFVMSRNYYVRVGTKPELPETIQGVQADGTTVNVPVVWGAIADADVAQAGTFTVFGTANGIGVSVNVSVIDKVSTLLNMSTVTPTGVVPTLPATRQAVMDDGTVLDASFEVNWNMPEASAFAQEGVVTISGTASVLGQTVPVSASVRVADTVTSLGDSITSVANLSQSVPEDKQSDTLDSIKDGNTVFSENKPDGKNNLNCWSNYKNCYDTPENNTAYIDFAYDTQQTFGKFIVYFMSDSWSASYPDDGTTKWQVSEDGVNWADVKTTESKGTASGGVMPYTYELEAPVTATYVRLNLTNTTTPKPYGSGTHNPCTCITEVELISVNRSAIAVGSNSALSSLSLDGTAINADALATGTVSTKSTAPVLEYTADENAAVTVLPVQGNRQYIVVQSEDGQSITKYTLVLGVEEPDDASRDIPYTQYTATDGSHQPNGTETGPSAVDGDESTKWHSIWNGGSYDDFWLEIEIDEPYVVDGLRYLPRQDGSINGRILQYRIEAMLNDGSWVEVASGSWADNASWKRADFETPVTTNRVRLWADLAGTDNLQGQVFASAAEVRLTQQKKAEITLDTSTLDAAMAAANALNLVEYADGAEKTALASALADAESVKESAVMQYELDNAAKAVNDAVANLLKVKLDYSALQAAIADAEAVDLSGYADDAAKTTFQSALASAKALDGKAATQSAIDAAVTALTNAKAGLHAKVNLNYSIMEMLMSENLQPDLTDFPDGAAKDAYQSALAAAQALDHKAETQEQINTATRNLSQALLSLRYAPDKERLANIR